MRSRFLFNQQKNGKHLCTKMDAVRGVFKYYTRSRKIPIFDIKFKFIKINNNLITLDDVEPTFLMFLLQKSC